MAREIRIVVDDKTKAVGISGNEAFTALELLGIAHHFRLCAEANHMAAIQMAVAQNLEKKIQIAQAVGDGKGWPTH